MALMKPVTGQFDIRARPLHSLPELIKAAALLDELHDAERTASLALIELSQLPSHAQVVSMDVSECCDRYGHPQEEGGQAPCC
jgi:hypothetical protein